MKTKTILCVLLAFILASCANQQKTETTNEDEKNIPIEGAWELVYFKVMLGDSLVYEITKIDPESLDQIKIWSKGYTLFIYQSETDTLIQNGGAASYTLDGNQYQESIIYHQNASHRDKTVNMKMEYINDTLIQSWDSENDGKLYSSVEKYLRLD
jgi:hypothetical protein